MTQTAASSAWAVLLTHPQLEPAGPTSVIYQVFVDRFAPTPGSCFAPVDDLNARLGGTIWGLVDQLDVIAELGVDTLWLTPIFASPQYHGYAVSDFLVIAPELGGQEAWEALVGRCRQRGLRIVLDFVANHISNQHAAFQQALLAPDAPTRPWLRFRAWPHDYGWPRQLRRRASFCHGLSRARARQPFGSA